MSNDASVRVGVQQVVDVLGGLNVRVNNALRARQRSGQYLE